MSFLNNVAKVKTENGYVQFLTVAQFKSNMEVETMEVLKNPHTEKLFLSTGEANYKVQGDIDLKNKLGFIIENGKIEDACLINVKEGAEVIGTL